MCYTRPCIISKRAEQLAWLTEPRWFKPLAGASYVILDGPNHPFGYSNVPVSRKQLSELLDTHAHAGFAVHL